MKDIKIEYMRGQGPGGQHKNKVNSTVRVTHIPTGISVIIDGRDQHKNKKKALAELDRRLKQKKLDEKAKIKKDRRDKKIKERDVIRTYDFKTGLVRDHRSGKTASIKNVLIKGRIDLLK